MAAELQVVGEERAIEVGQPFDLDRLEREIQHEMELILVSARRIGEALLQAKAHLGSGHFERWIKDRLPFGAQTARNYMRVAEFFRAHPRLAEPLAEGRLKNVLLLTSLPPELEDALAEDGGLGQVPADELGRMPYAELKKLKDSLEADLGRERRRADAAEALVAERNALLAQATERRIGDQRSRRMLEACGDLRGLTERLMAQVGFELELAAQIWDELTPEAQAEVAGFVAWLETWTRVERLRHELLRGADTPAYLLHEALEEPRPAASRWPIPAERSLPDFGDGGR